jgi:hypothetical protein
MLKDQTILSFPQSFKLMKDFLKGLKGNYWVEIRRCRQQRTLDQNAFFHGVWLPIIAERLTELWGENVTPDTAKAYVKDEFLRWPIVNKETGETFGYETRGTSQLDVKEFSEFLDKIYVWALRYLDEELPESNRSYEYRYAPAESRAA